VPTAELLGQQVEPLDLLPPDWPGDSDKSSEDECGGLAANHRSSRRDLAGSVSDTDSSSSSCGLGGRGRGDDAEDSYSEIRTRVADASSRHGSVAGDAVRCAPPEPAPVAAENSQGKDEGVRGVDDAVT
jgi:hypothetical protein